MVIFLVVSGFLIYRPFVMSQLTGGRAPGARAYLWRRVLRIVPAYWVALAVATLLVPYHGVFTARGVPTYFGFAQIYRGVDDRGRRPAGVDAGPGGELLPLPAPVGAGAARGLGSHQRRIAGPTAPPGVGVGGLWLFSVAYKAVLMKTGAVPVIPGSPQPALVTLPGYIDEFALGMGLAVFSAWLRAGRRRARGGPPRRPSAGRGLGLRPGRVPARQPRHRAHRGPRPGLHARAVPGPQRPLWRGGGGGDRPRGVRRGPRRTGPARAGVAGPAVDRGHLLRHLHVALAAAQPRCWRGTTARAGRTCGATSSGAWSRCWARSRWARPATTSSSVPRSRSGASFPTAAGSGQRTARRARAARPAGG